MSGSDDWNRHRTVPRIKETKSSAHTHSLDSRGSSAPEYDDYLDDKYTEMHDESYNVHDTGAQFQREELDPQDDIPPSLSPGTKEQRDIFAASFHIMTFVAGEEMVRNNTYSTIPRSQSELSLKAAAASPPPNRKNSLRSVAEEDDPGHSNNALSQNDEVERGHHPEDVPEAEPASHQDDPSRGRSKGKDGGCVCSFKKESLASLGLATSDIHTQYDEDESLNDDEAPGAFERPGSAFKLAM